MSCLDISASNVIFYIQFYMLVIREVNMMSSIQIDMDKIM
jgi:hypothetical protein